MVRGRGELTVDRRERGRFNLCGAKFAKVCRRGHDRRWGAGYETGAAGMKTLIMAAALLAASMGTGLAQDVAKGETAFKKCLPCHSIGADAVNKVGPELNGLDGRHSGNVPNYNYTDANKNSGIVWNEANFKEYIKDPKAKIPGTKMAFAGIKNEQEINDLWAYLKQFDAEGNVKK
jgi:cytochrome c